MFYTLGTAAKAGGISKSTVLRAVRDHRISAAKGDTGDWQIDPAEFHRVFPPVSARNGGDHAADRDAVRGATPEHPPETALFEARIAGLNEVADLMRRQMDDLRADRDAWRDQAQAGARLLTHQQAAIKRSWWRWLRSSA